MQEAQIVLHTGVAAGMVRCLDSHAGKIVVGCFRPREFEMEFERLVDFESSRKNHWLLGWVLSLQDKVG